MMSLRKVVLVLFFFILFILLFEVIFYLRMKKIGPPVYLTTERVSVWYNYEDEETDMSLGPGGEFTILEVRDDRALIRTKQGGVGWIEKERGYQRK